MKGSRSTRSNRSEMRRKDSEIREGKKERKKEDWNGERERERIRGKYSKREQRK